MAANRLDQLIDEWAIKLAKAFLEAVYATRDRAQINVIAERLERGDVDGALKAVGLDPIRFRGLSDALYAAFEAGGNFQEPRIPSLRQPDGYRLRIEFDIGNARAERWLSERAAMLIREITADQREMIRQALTNGMAAGRNGRSVALDLVGRINKATGQREGGLIGLTTSQQGWVDAYAAELDGVPKSSALTRSLRDKRFDAAVRKAIANKVPLPADLKEKMLAAYKNRALRFRGEAIGRTEAISSLHRGALEAMEQAIDGGQIEAAAVEKVWHSAHDLRVRDTHRSIDGKRISFRDPGFVTSSGALVRYPGDPDAPAAEVVNCRCWMDLRIDHLRGLR